MTSTRRTCARCGDSKSRDEFSPHRTGPGGLHSHCRACRRESDRLRRSDPNVREQERLNTAERRSDPVIAQRDRETSRAWKRRNPERVAEMNRSPRKIETNAAWGRANRDRKLAQTRAYQARHPEVLRNSANRRRDRVSDAGKLTAAEWRQIVADFNGMCAYCLRSDVRLQQEHMTPISRGGRHDVANVVPACADCNYWKHAKNLLQFATFGGGLLTTSQ